MDVPDTLAARVDLAATIAAVVPAGWRVAVDARDVNPPCVIVGAPNLDEAPCGWIGDIPVHVVAAGPGNLDALAAVLPVVDLLRPVLDFLTPAARPGVYYPDPSGDNGLPAYQLTVAFHT